MLASPVSAVIGASDPLRTAEFIGLFDFKPSAEATIPTNSAQKLYGVEGDLTELLLTADGNVRGSVRVVGPVAAEPVAGHYVTGAHAFDIYTRDIETSLDRVRATNYEFGAVGDVVLGPLAMKQVMITGPDDLVVVLIESDRRRPSLLDQEADRLHSEGHSFIWAVDSLDEAVEFWSTMPGLTIPFNAPVAHPEVNRFMGLPDPDVTLRMAMICDSDVQPMRLELLEFVGRKGEARPSWPISAGLHAPAFEVEDLDAVRSEMNAILGDVVTIDSPVHRRSRACTAVTASGVRFELWEATS